MDIGYTTPVVYPFVKGGAEKRIHEIGRRLANRGHEVTVYSRHWWDGPKARKYKGMHHKAIAPEREIYADGDRRSITSALELASKLVGPVRNADHDILITPVAPYFHVFSSELAGIMNDTELVVTWHEVWDDYWYDYMGQAGRVGKIIEHLTAFLPQHAVVPSKMTERKLQSLTGIASDDIKVIPNGIDVESIRNTNPISDGFDIIYAGRLIKDKNVDILLKAFDSIERDVTLGIIGDGPQYDVLTNQAKSLDNSTQIEFLGFLEEYDDVIAHMRAADVFASPSVREGFGITFLEAMASGCRVIAAEDSNSAASEIVGDAGFVIDPNVSDVTQALRQTLDGKTPPVDPVQRAESFDWKRVTDKMEEFLENLVTEPRKTETK